MLRVSTCPLWIVMAIPVLATEIPADRDAAYRQYLDYQDMIDSGRVTTNWLPDGSMFWYATGSPNDREILKVDPAGNRVEPLFDTARLRGALTAALGHEPVGTGVPFEQFQFTQPGTVSFSMEGASYTLDLDDYRVTKQLPPSTFSIALVKSEAERAVPGTYLRERFQGLGPLASPEALSPDGQWIATIRNNNLVLRACLPFQPSSG